MSDELSQLDSELREPYRIAEDIAPRDIDGVHKIRGILAGFAQMEQCQGVIKQQVEALGVSGVLYLPSAHNANTAYQASFFWIHGGGFVAGVPELFQSTMQRIVLDLGIPVFAPRYALAPENPYPAGLNDVSRAWVWWNAEGAKEYHAAGPIAVGGYSAGGGMALSLALKNRDEDGPPIAALILDYPALSAREDDSMRNVKTKTWSSEACRLSVKLYTAEPYDLKRHPYAWPADHTSYKDLPVTQINIAEHDTLRDSAVAVAMRIIRESKHGAEMILTKGTFHASNGFVPAAQVSIFAHDAIISFLRRTLMVEAQERAQ